MTTSVADAPIQTKPSDSVRQPAWLDGPEPRSFRPKRKYRTVWISDIHLGTRGCNAPLLNDFLQSVECETLYLVGDIVDGWRLSKGWYWPDSHNEVVRRLLKIAHRGTRVVYIVGNHDEMLRDYAGFSFGGIEVREEAIHETLDGRRLLVTHGDAFDSVVLYARWLAFLGDKAYSLLLRANVLFNRARRALDMPYWSLSAHIKRRVKNAVQYVCRYEEAVIHEAQERGVDGVVCGHIHTAEIRQIGDMTYYNDGDWVESCTAIATDAWFPQVNGVVRSLSTTVDILFQRGFEIELITPDQFITVPMPGYREIRLAIAPRFTARRALGAFRPDVVHIVTEGPIGWSARSWCMANDVPFTSAFHTRFPDYAAVRTGLSPDRFWPIMRRFHAPSAGVMVSTGRLADELAERGIERTRLWSRGIDKAVFRPDAPAHPMFANLPRPIHLSVGRIAVEKNLDAFLSLNLPGTKVVVGDGPARDMLSARYPDVVFTGPLHGEDLASAYRAADVFVFPSLTDTFGLVIIEALACGVPVAAYPVQGPIDIVGESGRGLDATLTHPVAGVDDDLAVAIAKASRVSRQAAAEFGNRFDWERCTDQFQSVLEEALAMRSSRATSREARTKSAA
jgi:UDP-2,3-diacylglucosamine pyrophosphatase LpxH/glycosyltransferase involved in cell wall biosynthesis